jgi:Protein kinase domain
MEWCLFKMALRMLVWTARGRQVLRFGPVEERSQASHGACFRRLTYAGEGFVAACVGHRVLASAWLTRIACAFPGLLLTSFWPEEQAVLQRPQPGSTTVLNYVLQLTAALEYIHSEGIVHRDLTANNVLLTRVGPATRVKVADFGLACVVSSSTGSMCTSQKGTAAYFAPEKAQGLTYGKSADMWVVFCLLPAN